MDAEPEFYTPEAYLKDKARLAATPESYQIPDETGLAAIATFEKTPLIIV